MPGVGDVGRADQAGVVGEDDGEPGPGDHGLAGGRQVQRQAAVERGVDREQADVAGGVDLVDHHHPALAHRLHERRVHERDLPAGAGDRHPFVAEEELVRGRAGLHLDEAVERRAAAVLDRAAALGPQPVGDRARDLALARAGRADQAQEARARPGRPCPAARARARRRARRAASAGRSACRRAARSARSAARARARRRGGGRAARSPSAATSSSCARAAVIALMRGLLSIGGSQRARRRVGEPAAQAIRPRRPIDACAKAVVAFDGTEPSARLASSARRRRGLLIGGRQSRADRCRRRRSRRAG